MSFRPAAGSLTDPFFAEIRRRRPDLDLILLPPQAPETGSPATAEPGAEEALAGDRMAVARAAEQLLAAGESPRVVRGSRPGTVRVRVRLVVHGSASPLARIARTCQTLGWQAHRTTGRVARLVATSEDGRTLEASYAERGTAVLQLTGPDRAVGATRARALTGDA